MGTEEHGDERRDARRRAVVAAVARRPDIPVADLRRALDLLGAPVSPQELAEDLIALDLEAVPGPDGRPCIRPRPADPVSQEVQADADGDDLDDWVMGFERVTGDAEPAEVDDEHLDAGEVELVHWEGSAFDQDDAGERLAELEAHLGDDGAVRGPGRGTIAAVVVAVVVVVLALLAALGVFSDDGDDGGVATVASSTTGTTAAATTTAPAGEPTQSATTGAGGYVGDPALAGGGDGVDDFERDEADGLGAFAGGEPWEVTTGGWSVVDGVATYTAAGDGEAGSGIALSPVASVDGRMQVRLPELVDSTGLVFRYHGPDDYWALVTSPAYATFTLVHVIDGEVHSSGNTGLTKTITPGTAVIGVDVEGSKIEVLVDGEVRKTFLDSDAEPGDRWGIGTLPGIPGPVGFDDVSYDVP